MMTTLPSPPLSPMGNSYTSPNLMTNVPNPKSSYRKKTHHRHPPRRHDTFELIQALMIEHQRLEQQEYETMLREAPLISCRNTTNAPKGILVNANSNRNDNKSLLMVSSSPPRRTPATTTTSLNNSLPQSPHDTNDHPCSTITSTPLYSKTQHHQSTVAYSPPSSIGSSISSSSLSSSSPPLTSNSYSSSSLPSPLSAPSPIIARHHVVRFAPGPPKVYTYQRIPILLES